MHGPRSRRGRALRDLFALGRERTIEQDPAFALRILVDIAIKALSPAVNDPTTAVQVLDHIEAFVEVVARAELHDQYALHGHDEAVRVVIPGRGWAEYLELAVTEIRDYGATSTQVCRRLRALLDALPQPPRPQPTCATSCADSGRWKRRSRSRRPRAGPAATGRARRRIPQARGRWCVRCERRRDGVRRPAPAAATFPPELDLTSGGPERWGGGVSCRAPRSESPSRVTTARRPCCHSTAAAVGIAERPMRCQRTRPYWT